MIITFNVEDILKKNIQSSISAGALVHSLFNVKMSSDELIKTATEKEIKGMSNKLDNIKEKYRKLKKNEAIISNTNTLLNGLHTNVFLKQFVTITTDLMIREKVYLCGNGYFRDIYNPTNVVIPLLNLCGWDSKTAWSTEQERTDFIKPLNKDCIYIFDDYGEREPIEIDMHNNINDNINYNESYMNICLQLLKKNKLTPRQDVDDCVDLEDEADRINISFEIYELINIILSNNPLQEIYIPYNYQYPITLKEIKKIIDQIKKGA